jgi:hypothetical protein
MLLAVITLATLVEFHTKKMAASKERTFNRLVKKNNHRQSPFFSQ